MGLVRDAARPRRSGSLGEAECAVSVADNAHAQSPDGPGRAPARDGWGHGRRGHGSGDSARAARPPQRSCATASIARTCAATSRRTPARCWPTTATTSACVAGSGCPSRAVTWCPRVSRCGAHRLGQRVPLPEGLRPAAVPAEAGQSGHGQTACLPQRRSTAGWANGRAPTAGTAAASCSVVPTCGSWRRTSSGRSTRRRRGGCSTPVGCGASSRRRGAPRSSPPAKRIGLVPFRTSGRSYIYWFPFKHLKKPGVLDLGARSKGASRSARWRVPGCPPSSRARRSVPRPPLSRPLDAGLRRAGDPGWSEARVRARRRRHPVRPPRPPALRGQRVRCAALRQVAKAADRQA